MDRVCHLAAHKHEVMGQTGARDGSVEVELCTGNDQGFRSFRKPADSNSFRTNSTAVLTRRPLRETPTGALGSPTLRRLSTQSRLLSLVAFRSAQVESQGSCLPWWDCLGMNHQHAGIAHVDVSMPF